MSTKLLLADDSVTIQRVVELTFSGEDVQVLAVGDGEEAIARIPAERPDIILADIGMPKRSGYEVSAFVKGRPELERIPVLLLAGAFEPVDEIKAKAARCDGVLVKPFEPQHVIARVRELVDGAKEIPVQSPVSPENLMDINIGDLLPSEELLPPVNDADSAASPLILDQSLDDYFDKLDEAFATINGSARPGGTPVETHRAAAPVLVESDFASLDDLPAVNTSPRQSSEGLEVLADLEPVPTDEPIDIPTLDDLLADIPPSFEPSPSIDFSADVAPALVAPAMSLQSLGLDAADRAPVAAVLPAPAADTGSIIADAFTALLAVEAGEPGAAAPRLPVNGASPVLTEAMLEDVARRVAQRVALGSSDQLHRMVKEIVSSVSERLVREEIDRIRRNAPRS